MYFYRQYRDTTITNVCPSLPRVCFLSPFAHTSYSMAIRTIWLRPSIAFDQISQGSGLFVLDYYPHLVLPVCVRLASLNGRTPEFNLSLFAIWLLISIFVNVYLVLQAHVLTIGNIPHAAFLSGRSKWSSLLRCVACWASQLHSELIKVQLVQHDLFLRQSR